MISYLLSGEHIVFRLPYELWIAAKYVGIIKKTDDKFISFISVSSVIGISLGVAALLVVVSVMNGFQKEIKDRILSVTSHVEISSSKSQYNDLKNDFMNKIFGKSSYNSISAYSSFISSQAIILSVSGLSKARGIQVTGIDFKSYCNVSDLGKSIIFGDSNDLELDKSNGIIIGNELAMIMNLGLGDKLSILSPDFLSNINSFTPKTKQFLVTGIFKSGYYDYDANVVFIDISNAYELFSDNCRCGIRILLDDIQTAPYISKKIRDSLDWKFLVQDWSYSNKNLFIAIRTEKRMMFIILSMIITVAAFNLFSSLIMVVKDRESEIAIMRTIGISASKILTIFTLVGLIIGLIGTFIGIVSGILILQNLDFCVNLIESIMKVDFLPSDVYFINKFPVDIRINDIFAIACLSILLSLFATILPSYRASRLQPAKVLNRVK
ncbi:lipoprotein-releasing ABC transporter permease subunit [Candidatus Kinetoplastidibacterium galati]|uniref:Lipoprotein-releasing system permease protein n=1 Tax=Candidatus Kinetoplastidibacterium galati TCC219 TaxID=1208921 RepID=M1M146_9PROT|nr:lipoprotein-releasing ABC transporter permease subunit [Candidatus Kinetoplastibacterium galatii]AGF49014.1 lipoprotein-releasing system permease protein [Candidatus Kinetoplastibacterium galatii TCC219]